ncbi:hypothetical protein E2562_020229 [Oryza meyeriana var. granulata]|uniref:NAC domain-containing protein n=1 Tax=Oryza meyeriana var. granulata TaxID=110450 RepID=A0A6G1DKX8_9ORYZ|nr:hypothetical protein E2562_020229 [Oryza meyeriana var. granulata]
MAEQSPRASVEHPEGDVSRRLTGRMVVADYLAPMALRGALPDDVVLPGELTEGVDVYSAHPAALAPLSPCFWRGDPCEESSHWFVSAARPDGERRRGALGGLWMRYGCDKAYAGGDVDGGEEAMVFRRRFAFFDRCGDGEPVPTEWRMKEYRLNKRAAASRAAQVDPEAEEYVVCKVYNTGRTPGPPPLCLSGDDDAAHLNGGEAAAEQ